MVLKPCDYWALDGESGVRQMQEGNAYKSADRWGAGSDSRSWVSADRMA
jgi:hypothetical protein